MEKYTKEKIIEEMLFKIRKNLFDTGLAILELESQIKKLKKGAEE